MDFVFCNRCLGVPSAAKRDFFFTNCMHVYCKECVEAMRSKGSSAVGCVHCKKYCQVIQIGPNMPEKVKKLFTPLTKLMEQHKAVLKRKLKFDQDLLTSLMGHMKREKEMLEKAIRANTQLKGSVAKLTKEKADLEGSVEYHKKRYLEFSERVKAAQDELNGTRAPAFGHSATSFRRMDTSIMSEPGCSNLDETRRSEFDTTSNSFSNFLMGDSELTTPACSQMAAPGGGGGELTTPKILGYAPKKAPGGVRSDNPYMAMWNRTSVERHKKAAAAGGGGGGNRNRSMDASETMNWSRSVMKK